MPLIDRTDLQSRRGPGFRTRIVAELGLDLDKFAVQRLCVRKLYKPTGRVSSRLVARRFAAVSSWMLGHIGGTVRTHTDCHTLTGGSVIWMPVGLALPLGGVRTIG